MDVDTAIILHLFNNEITRERCFISQIFIWTLQFLSDTFLGPRCSDAHNFYIKISLCMYVCMYVCVCVYVCMYVCDVCMDKVVQFLDVGDGFGRRMLCATKTTTEEWAHRRRVTGTVRSTAALRYKFRSYFGHYFPCICNCFSCTLCCLVWRSVSWLWSGIGKCWFGQVCFKLAVVVREPGRRKWVFENCICEALLTSLNLT